MSIVLVLLYVGLAFLTGFLAGYAWRATER